MYVKSYIDRHGKQWHYFCWPGHGPQVPLPDKPGSPEFVQAWQRAAGMAKRIPGSRSMPGSVSAAIEAFYLDPRFTALADSTRAGHRRTLEKVREKVGGAPLSEMQKSDIGSFLQGLKPFARNGWLKTFHTFFRFAVEANLVESDPSAGIRKTSASEGGSIHTWSEAEVAQFEARHGIGSTARLAFALLLYTAQRRSDVVKLGPQHIRDGFLSVRQKKTKMAKQDRELRIPVHPELARIIEATPGRGALAFVLTKDGVPYTEKGFGARFADWCKQADMPAGCSAHGLRKTACRRLAEAGCTVHEIAAISGHASIAEVQRYTKAADQARLASAAMARLGENEAGETYGKQQNAARLLRWSRKDGGA